jgi:hypothetical protein
MDGWPRFGAKRRFSCFICKCAFLNSTSLSATVAFSWMICACESERLPCKTRGDIPVLHSLNSDTVLVRTFIVMTPARIPSLYWSFYLSSCPNFWHTYGALVTMIKYHLKLILLPFFLQRQAPERQNYPVSTPRPFGPQQGTLILSD